MTIYRQIYTENFGPIPQGYDIHHIDGDHTNNHPSNLKAVSIQEHYDIHYTQGDWYACFLISKRLNLTSEQRSDLAKKHAYKRVQNKTHHFLGPSNNKKRIENGTHPFLGGKIQKELIKKGIHNFQKTTKKALKEGKHICQQKLTCPHCNKNGTGRIMYRWHFKNCKFK